ncbi:MAG: 50S ribosomal protein L23 [candidate division Zixibacteria bacterium]|nr:50S ribosomal protein L23 [candidate division Zixibacteria bacterium]
MKSDLRHIIKSHVATERTTILREKNNEYVFVVDKHSNKYQIREAIQNAFKVNVDSIRTMIVAGKPRRQGRSEGKTPVSKKAIVRLKTGESISVFDNL